MADTAQDKIAPKDNVAEMGQTRSDYLRRDYEDKVDKLQKEHVDALNEKDREHNETIRQLIDEHQQELAGREEEKGKLVEEVYGLKEEIVNLNFKLNTKDGELTELKEQNKQNKKLIELIQCEINKEVEDSNVQVNDIKEYFQAKIDYMERINDITIEEERDELAEKCAKLTDELNILQEEVKSLRQKLEKKERKLTSEKQERLTCLAEQKMEKDNEIQRIQDRCDQQVHTVRERDDLVKEILRKELQQKNDEERKKLQSSHREETEKMEKELEDLRKRLEEERSKHEVLLQREIDCRERQRRDFDGFKKLFEEEKIKEIQLLKEGHERDLNSLKEEAKKDLRQKDEEMKCMLDRHQQDFHQKAVDFEELQNSHTEQLARIENEKQELQEALDRKVKENNDYINRLLEKHVKSETELRKEKRELEGKVDDLETQLRSLR